MRELRSNLYIFSTFMSDFGRIITSRVREGSPDGENVFAYLGISEEEQKFWRGIQWLKSCRLVMLCGNRDGRRCAVALARLSEGRGSIYLALEYFDAFDAVSILSEMPDWAVAVSDGAKGCFPSGTHEPCVDVGLDIASEIRDIMVLSDGRNSQGNEPAAEMWNLTCTAASLIGLGLKCNIKHDFDCETNAGTVFKRDFYAELIVLLAADARKYSRERSMSVKVTAQQNHCASARISYDRFSETFTDTEKHLEHMAQEFGIPISFSYSGDDCIARVTPFACDVALQGVKQDPRVFIYNT